MTDQDIPADDDTGMRHRPLVLAVLGAAAGLLAHAVIGETRNMDASAMRTAALALIVVAPVLFGLVVDRARLTASIVFALICGVMAGLIALWNGPTQSWSASEGWRMVAIILAIAIAAPLFQSVRVAQRRRFQFPYRSVHDHAWTNAVMVAAAWVFTGISFLMLFLLSELFALIGIKLLRDLLREDWFWRVMLGGAWGAGLGLIREQDKVVRLLQRVVMTILSVLGPVLGAALMLFLVSLPFTGLSGLWESWGSAAALLLSATIGCFVLANAIIGNGPEDEPRNPLLRYGAILLALVMFPLALLAATAIGLRIDQYGLTPERLWAIVFAAVACTVGLAYWFGLGRGRAEWARMARSANLRIALAVCIVAAILATPLVSFNAVATRDQLARIRDGRTKPDKVDWAALAFDFGEPGRAAVKRLGREARFAGKAKQALAAKSRWELFEPPVDLAKRRRTLTVLPAGTAVPESLVEAAANYPLCGDDDKPCIVRALPDGEWLVLDGGCVDTLAPTDRPVTQPGLAVEIRSTANHCALPKRVRRESDRWAVVETGLPETAEAIAAAKAGVSRGDVEVREVTRRQVFVGGVPIGDAFE